MSAQQTFDPRTVAGLVVAGIVAFAALLLLIAYGDSLGEWREPGGANAGSRSAVGYRGLVQLTGEFHDTYLLRSEEELSTEDLVIVAIDERTQDDDLNRLRELRRGKATLIILPKWATVPHESRQSWVRRLSPSLGPATARALGEGIEVRVERSAARVARGESFLDGISVPVPEAPQTLSGKDVEPLLRLPGGGALIARLGDGPLYVAADPDLFNNHGISDPARARAALAAIEALQRTDGETVNFDVAVNGLVDATAERDSPSLMRTLFEPPFLVLTLGLVAAALLAGLHGLFRFGPARAEERAIAFGKEALVENSAGLIRVAGREARIGGAYADLVRQEAARSTGGTQRLKGDELDSYLNRLSLPDRPTFSELTARLHLARDRHELMAAARALYQWKKEIIR